MLRVRVPLVIVIAIASTAAAAGDPSPAVKTIVVVRHAEAEPDSVGPDRPLNPQGRQRALELARVLGESRPTAVYTTPLPRSRLTAEPLARAAGAPVIALDDTAKTLAALAAAPWGTTLVVIGHSNTVPQLVSGLTRQPFPANEKVAHDRMWVITLGRDGAISTLQLRYGPVDSGEAH
jgi:broad specificity phosphatase PhoE